ncbi:MAG: hypothetical protein M3680_10370 [Myxococcota bacterium]|nr:hypothetical protein [Myxococcota bacterium]
MPEPRAAEDPLITPERCVQTAYSFAGCAATYPVEARTCLRHRCEHGGDRRSIRDTICLHHGETLIDGIGGPVERAAGLAIIERLCRGDDPVSCARLAELVVDFDRERAVALFHRGCDDEERAPVGQCELLRRRLGIAADRPERFLHDDAEATHAALAILNIVIDLPVGHDAALEPGTTPPILHVNRIGDESGSSIAISEDALELHAALPTVAAWQRRTGHHVVRSETWADGYLVEYRAPADEDARQLAGGVQVLLRSGSRRFVCGTSSRVYPIDRAWLRAVARSCRSLRTR